MLIGHQGIPLVGITHSISAQVAQKFLSKDKTEIQASYIKTKCLELTVVHGCSNGIPWVYRRSGDEWQPQYHRNVVMVYSSLEYCGDGKKFVGFTTGVVHLCLSG